MRKEGYQPRANPVVLEKKSLIFKIYSRGEIPRIKYKAHKITTHRKFKNPNIFTEK